MLELSGTKKPGMTQIIKKKFFLMVRRGRIPPINFEKEKVVFVSSLMKANILNAE